MTDATQGRSFRACDLGDSPFYRLALSHRELPMQSSADGWSHAGVGLGEVAGWRRDLHVRKTGGQPGSFVGEVVRGTLSWAKIVPGRGTNEVAAEKQTQLHSVPACTHEADTC